MPSIYVSTTVVQKLNLCDDFFEQNEIRNIYDLERCPPFRKINMFVYLKQLCVRSLRSKRSCMASLVHTMRENNHVFAELYAQTKAIYDKQHPPPLQPRKIIIRTKKITTLKIKPAILLSRPKKIPKQTTKPRPPPKPINEAKKTHPKPRAKPRPRPKPQTTKTTSEPRESNTRDHSKLRRIESTVQRRTINGGITYAQQQYIVQDAIVYVGLDDFVECERTRLENDIISLTHAIEYASRKMSAACDIDQLLNDVVHKLTLG